MRSYHLHPLHWQKLGIMPGKALYNTLNGAFAEYRIQPEDIYNFDETGFAMGLCATNKVVTSSEQHGCTKLLQPGNCKWVTVIESVNASG